MSFEPETSSSTPKSGSTRGRNWLRWRRASLALAVLFGAIWAYSAANERTLPALSPSEEMGPIEAEDGNAYVAKLRFESMSDRRLQRASAVMYEGKIEPARPLDWLRPYLGWARVYYYLEGLIAKRFPDLTRTRWMQFGRAVALPDEVRKDGHGAYEIGRASCRERV